MDLISANARSTCGATGQRANSNLKIITMSSLTRRDPDKMGDYAHSEHHETSADAANCFPRRS